MKTYNLHNRRFIPIANEKGLASGATIFHYLQEGDVITATYKGGAIASGNIVGRQTGPDEIALLFQCVTENRELKAGQSKGKITEDEQHNLLLTFEWNWLNGDLSGGFSYYREVR